MNTRIITTTFALGLALPIAAWSQSNGSNSSNGNNASGSGGQQWSQNQASNDSSSSGIRRISEDRLDSRLTASSLIGTKVVDRNGEDVGEVKDIGLAASLPRDLRKQGGNDQGMAARAGQDLSDFAQRATRNANIYVSVGGVWGMGNEIVSVPANKLHRDGDNLKLDVTKDALKSVTSSDRSSGQGASD